MSQSSISCSKCRKGSGNLMCYFGKLFSYLPKLTVSGAWWHICSPNTLEAEAGQQEFKASLGYIVSFKPAWTP